MHYNFEIICGKTLKRILLLTFALLSCSGIKAQATKVDQNGPFRFEASYIGDGVGNFSGGIRKATEYLGLTNFRIGFDTKAAHLWENGSFLLNAANTHGSRPTKDMTGDYQGVSNIEAGNLTYLHELWYKQTIGVVSITAGLQDLSSGFASTENGALFINGSFGVHSTIAHNVPAPVFPLTALGIQAQLDISEKVTGKLAFFDGHPEEFENNPYNLSWDFSPREGILTISELSYSTEMREGLPGIYKFGVYYHNHLEAINKSDGNPFTDDYGLYLSADQVIKANGNGEKLAVFSQLGVSPYRKNENNIYIGAGITYAGFWIARNNDAAGAALAYAGFANGRKDETTVELFYKAQLTENIYIQPDIQYIINPAGTKELLNNALAGIIRIGVNF